MEPVPSTADRNGKVQNIHGVKADGLFRYVPAEKKGAVLALKGKTPGSSFKVDGYALGAGKLGQEGFRVSLFPAPQFPCVYLLQRRR
jgi:hypothetical protein